MLSQPKALPYLFLTEMWERFGFYVVQGMLVLYMSQVYGFSDDQSFTITGMFTALAYISPLLGGYLADQALGFKKSIYIGSVLLIVGYALLASSHGDEIYLALATIVVGTGLFKPNISSLLGSLYETGDVTRDTGFTVFYIGIYVGVLLAGLSSGYMKDHFGWSLGFALASVGLFIGLCIFILGVRKTGMHSYVQHNFSKSKWFTTPFLLVYGILTLALFDVLFRFESLGKWVLPIVGVILLFFTLSLIVRQHTQHKSNLIILNVLIFSSVVFWALYFQMFLSMSLFIDRLVDRSVFGCIIPTTFFYTLESIFVILLGPFFAYSWSVLNQQNKNFSPILKFAIAIIFAGLGCLTFAISIHFAGVDGLVNPLWILLAYLFVTIGEMLLSPIGLSAITLMSPPHLTGLMMGIWFTSLGFGGEFAGILAKLASIPLEVIDPKQQLMIYQHAFMQYTFIAAGVAIAILCLYQLLRYWSLYK